MAQEFNPAIRIETGDSERTVKSLKQEIAALRDNLLNLTEGTEEYDKVVKQLQKDQKDLDTVMAVTKKSTNAVEGSYDALVQKLASLKKEWRAMAQTDSQWGEKAKEIAEVKEQLKAMDGQLSANKKTASVTEGSYDSLIQKLASLKNEWKSMSATDPQWSKKAEEIAEVTKQIKEMDEQLSANKKTVSVAEGSYNDLTQQLANLKKEWKATNDAAVRSEISKEISEVNARIKELDAEMSATKRTVTSLDGSYDALVQQMSELKKEWRATNDTARRSELAEEIAKINGELKEMDAEIGNFQRNVGNYVSHWDGMEGAVRDFGGEMREAMESIEPTKAKFESVQKVAAGLASGFAAVQGAAALLGLENENLEKSLVKVQAAMALAQGIGGIGDLVEGIGKAKVAFAGLTDKVKLLSKTMGKAGWIGVILAVVSAIAALTTHIIKNRRESDRFSVSIKEQQDLLKKTAESSGNLIAEYKILQNQYVRLNSVADKQKWIEDNASAFNNLGIQIKSVNDADKLFVEQSDLVIAALKARAEAEAFEGKYKEEVIKAEDEKRTVTKKDASTPIFTTDSKLPESYKNLGLEESDFEYEWGGGQSGAGFLRPITDKALEILSQKYEEEYNAQIDLIDAEANFWEAKMEDAQKKAEEAARKININNKDVVEEEEEEKDPNEALKKSIEDRIKLEESATARKLVLMQVEKDKEIANAYQTITDKEKLEEELKSIEEKYAEEEYNIELEAAERKLEILNEWKTANTDADTEQLVIKQEVADQEVEIERLKWERIKAVAEAGRQASNQTPNQTPNQTVSSTTETSSTEENDDDGIDKKEKDIQTLSDYWNTFKDSVKNFDEVWAEMDFGEKAGMITNVTNAMLSNAGQILDTIASQYEADGEVTKEEAEKVKKLRIASATIDMLQGAITAYASAQSLGVPLGPIVGGVNAAAVIAMGTMNIQKIKQTDFSGTVPSGVNAGSVVPSPSTYTSELPVNYTRQITSASETDTLNQDTKVYVLESDITNAVNKQKVRVEESSF